MTRRVSHIDGRRRRRSARGTAPAGRRAAAPGAGRPPAAGAAGRRVARLAAAHLAAPPARPGARALTAGPTVGRRRAAPPGVRVLPAVPSAGDPGR
ncbi:hypothetical protein C5N14_17765 [Micromonospora sp. MW-13]|uniref:hypothetical protein n=1 Tax=Micromonospora sp. MW-13 TaxID=2094022 RepID=UPI000E440E40|nr:hypothetical protein [Micromonospora sp. MW-13]RGC67628.1 hypothetical protein C5N14_17765 [Micromonospora sp. MW-13]